MFLVPAMNLMSCAKPAVTPYTNCESKFIPCTYTIRQVTTWWQRSQGYNLTRIRANHNCSVKWINRKPLRLIILVNSIIKPNLNRTNLYTQHTRVSITNSFHGHAPCQWLNLDCFEAIISLNQLTRCFHFLKLFTIYFYPPYAILWLYLSPRWRKQQPSELYF